jgi:hypothetical protein
MYVQYGCGFSAPKEWTNFDASPTLKWERIPVIGKLYTRNPQRFPANVRCGDIVTGLPVPSGSCRGVYASHVLEHLALDDFHTALENSRKILHRDGIFRLVVPDLEWHARDYVRRCEAGDWTANTSFLEGTGLGRAQRPRGLTKRMESLLQTSAHLWMWDAISLAHALEEHGFSSVRRSYLGDCADPMFALVEDPDRYERAIAMEVRN